MANPNLASAGNIYAKTDLLAVSTSSTAITSNSASSGKVLKVNSLLIANTGSSSVDATAKIVRSSSSYKLANIVSVPAGSTLVVLGKENPVYLLEGDSIEVAASAASSLDAVCSYEEIS